MTGISKSAKPATGSSRPAWVLRSYRPADEAAVDALWRSVFPDDPPWNDPPDVVRRKMLVQPDLFLVGELNGRLAGTVVAGFDGVRGWIHKLAVDPEYQRRGLAKRLMSEAERRLGELGCPKVNLQVRATNEGVVAFYRGLGYDVEERVSMGKRLAN